MISKLCIIAVVVTVVAAQFRFDPDFAFQDFRPPPPPSRSAPAPRKPAKAVTSEEQSSAEEDVNTIPGVPGENYPTYHSIPSTGFNCDGKIPGYYADTEARCQAWHYCDDVGHFESFLCPNGTIYHQGKRVCEWWFSVDCSRTLDYIDVNKDLYIIPEKKEDDESS